MKVKVTKPLKHDGELFERGSVVDLEKEQAENYLLRGLAVRPGAELDDDSPERAPDLTTQPSESDGEALVDAAGNTLPPWALKITPIEYIDRFDSDAPNTELAHTYIKAGHGEYAATLI